VINEQNKYRLIGALALIVVALLSIPFFLKDKSSDTGVELAPIPIDEAAQKKAPTVSEETPVSPVPMKEPDHNDVKIHGDERTVLPPPPPADKMKPQPTLPDKAKPNLPDNPLAIPVPKQQSSSVKPPAMKKAVQPQRVVMQKHGWVAQVGVFSNRLNAQRLIDRLHSRGFHASVRKIQARKHHQSLVQYQVIVGPVSQHRNIANKRLARLNHRLQVKGFVIKI